MKTKKRNENVAAGASSAIDGVDREIIAILQRDGRVSNRAIGRQIGMTGTSVGARIDKLLKNGVFRFTATTDPAKFGYEKGFLIGLECDISRSEEIIPKLKEMPEVRFAVFTTGEFDLVLLLRLPSDRDIFDFVKEELRVLPGVQKTVTSVVVKDIKRAWDWVLPEF